MKRTFLYFLVGTVLSIVACSKDNYYEDSGVHDPKFNGNIVQYLESKAIRPIDPFDTLIQVVKLAGLEDVLKNDKVTFFAPPDPSIGKAVSRLNSSLYLSGQDTITSLDEVKPEVWKYFLSQYIIKEDLGLIDFPQLDTAALYAYSGQLYQTYNPEHPLNVGVVFHDLRNEESVIKYKGPRQLMISFIPDFTKPKSGWINSFISSSNIQPTNGRVHVINYNRHTFGFDPFRFTSMAREYGIDYK